MTLRGTTLRGTTLRGTTLLSTPHEGLTGRCSLRPIGGVGPRPCAQARASRAKRVFFGEKNRAGTATGLSHPCAEFRQLRVRIDNVAFERAMRRPIVTAVVQRYPKPMKIARAAEFGPGHSDCHTCRNGPRPRDELI